MINPNKGLRRCCHPFLAAIRRMSFRWTRSAASASSASRMQWENSHSLSLITAGRRGSTTKGSYSHPNIYRTSASTTSQRGRNSWKSLRSRLRTPLRSEGEVSGEKIMSFMRWRDVCQQLASSVRTNTRTPSSRTSRAEFTTLLMISCRRNINKSSGLLRKSNIWSWLRSTSRVVSLGRSCRRVYISTNLKTLKCRVTCAQSANRLSCRKELLAGLSLARRWILFLSDLLHSDGF